MHVAVTGHRLRHAAHERNMDAEIEAVARDEAVLGIVSECVETGGHDAGTLRGTEFLVFEILAEGDELHAAIKRVVAAEGGGDAFVLMDARSRAAVAVHRRVGDEHRFNRALLEAHGGGRIAVRIRHAFAARGIRLRVVLEGIHRVAGEAREGRGAVGNRVVDARPHGSRHRARTKGLGVVGKERVDRAEEAVGAEDAAEDRKATHGESAEVARERERGFAAEEAAVLLHASRVGFKARFEDEAELHAVPEVFASANAPAGAEFLTRGHFEGVGGIRAGGIRIGMDEGKACIKDAVNLRIRSKGAHGGAGKKPGDGESRKRLFHD